MKKIVLTSTLLLVLFLGSFAQERVWTLSECMQYAMEHSPKVKQKFYQTDSYKADRISAIGNFLPYVGGNIEAGYSYGRNTDPETNQYSDISTFGNEYRFSANLPLFTGGQLINKWRQSKVNVLLGKNDEQLIKDDLSMKIMNNYIDVLYYQGTIKMAEEKLAESKRTLYQAQRQEELGLKSKADVAMIEAQVAGDDYTLTLQQNQYNTAFITLKENMNYPYEEDLVLDTLLLERPYFAAIESIQDIFEYAMDNEPGALQSKYNFEYARLEHLRTKGDLFPQISMYANIGTGYYDVLSSKEKTLSFSEQFKNRRSESFGFSVSFPLFNRFTTTMNIRKAKNQMRIAAEQQTESLRQLQSNIEQNVMERDGYAKEIIQMEKKVAADELAYRLTLRKFEEGLMSSLDLQTSSNTLIESKATLLQKRLMFLMKSKIVDYYKGVPLIEE